MHLDSVVGCGVQSERTPTATNFEHALPRLELELVAGIVELCSLRLGKRCLFVVEPRATVSKGFVEESAVKLVAEVVVIRNVCLASA
jgi:hypothetical protein